MQHVPCTHERPTGMMSDLYWTLVMGQKVLEHY